MAGRRKRAVGQAAHRPMPTGYGCDRGPVAGPSLGSAPV